MGSPSPQTSHCTHLLQPLDVAVLKPLVCLVQGSTGFYKGAAMSGNQMGFPLLVSRGLEKWI